MNAYNLVNGSHCSEQTHLLSDILKEEWGFRGFIVSDWRSVHSIAAVKAGLDLEMPGPGTWLTPEKLKPLLAAGELDAARIDDAARRIVRTALLVEENKTHRGEPRVGEIDSERHRNLAFRAACESITLLKNERTILPVPEERVRSIAVIGPNAAEARLGGGGSSSVTPFYSVSPLEGLSNRCPESIQIEFVEGCTMSGTLPILSASNLRTSLEGGAPGLHATYFANASLSGPPILERTDRQIDFSWGWASPGGDLPKDEYSVRWEGFFVPSTDGLHRLGVSAADGGYRLSIDGTLVCDEWIDIGGRPSRIGTPREERLSSSSAGAAGRMRFVSSMRRPATRQVSVSRRSSQMHRMVSKPRWTPPVAVTTRSFLRESQTVSRAGTTTGATCLSQASRVG
jgi:beta-glucosidase